LELEIECRWNLSPESRPLTHPVLPWSFNSFFNNPSFHSADKNDFSKFTDSQPAWALLNLKRKDASFARPRFAVVECDFLFAP
jgi:hypothetical protein